MPSPVTKRRYERFDVKDAPLEAYRLGLLSLLTSRSSIGRLLVNISECGVQITLTERLAPGARLRIAAKIPKVSDTIEGEIVIRWCVPNGSAGGEFFAGAEFVSMPNGTANKIQHLRRFYKSVEFKQQKSTLKRENRENRESRERDKDDGLSYRPNPNT
jgi:hypothetical protein